MILMKMNVVLLIIGYILMLRTGSIRNIIGMIFMTISISILIINYNYILIPLIILASLFGIVMIIFLLKYISNNQLSYSSFFDLFLLEFLFINYNFNNINNNMLNINKIEIIKISIILNNIIYMSILIMIIYMATMIILHITIKNIIYQFTFNSIIIYWFNNIIILIIISILLSYLPQILRYYLNNNNNYYNKYRWSTDVYEVGISVPGSSYSIGLYSQYTDSNMGSIRILPFLFLFLLLDLESCIVLIGLLGHCQYFYFLIFLFILIFTLANELDKDPIN